MRVNRNFILNCESTQKLFNLKYPESVEGALVFLFKVNMFVYVKIEFGTVVLYLFHWR